MNNKKTFFCIMLSLTMLLVLFAGCGTKGEEPEGANLTGSELTDDASTVEEQPSGEQASGEQPGGEQASGETQGDETTGDTPFSYSEGIDENGFWEGIRALDHVEIFDYLAMSIPKNVHQITDDAVQTEIDYILTEFPSNEYITDREVIDGDTVNIDFVGSIDGVEFENGSTEGMGADVTIGVTSYIDDFLEQLIGHKPGEIIDVEVTFPDDYHEATLRGKDALFVTTINYIIEEQETELNDDFVMQNLSGYYGWTSVEEMINEIRSSMESSAIRQYIQEYLTTEVGIQAMPDHIVEYQKKALVESYTEYALYYYGIELEEFLVSYQGFSGVDEFIEVMQEDIQANAAYYLVIQAVAEDAGISASTGDVSDFFAEYYGTSDYSTFEEQYGLPYLKQIVINQQVLDHIAQNAILS